MKLAILSDIWGVDQPLTQWIDELARSSGVSRYELLSPYQAVSVPAFVDDGAAYLFFTEHGGLQGYSDRVRSWLAQQSGPVVMLGFSAGAAVAFQLAAESCHPAAIFAVYGGQIHRLSQLQLQCAGRLVFSNESHFDVTMLVSRLNQQPLLSAEHWPYDHGFANPRSSGFNAVARQQLTEELHQWLQQMRQLLASK